MAKGRSKERACVGVADHCGWAVLVTVAGGGALLDRRRAELVDPALPKLPHHHECQALPVPEAVKLVERVSRSADALASECPSGPRGAGDAPPLAAQGGVGGGRE